MLQGSITQDQLSSKQQDDTEEQRQLIKAQIRLGWSAEAVKQGVAHAKKGDYNSAISCYKKVENAVPAVPAWPNPRHSCEPQANAPVICCRFSVPMFCPFRAIDRSCVLSPVF